MNKLEQLINSLCPNGVMLKQLASFVSIERGKRVVREQLTEMGEYPVYQNSLTPLGFHSEFNYSEDTTFIIVAGAAGEIGYSTSKFWAADDCFALVCPEGVLGRYIYHAILNQQEAIRGKVRKASIPRLPRSVIENLVIPVPPIPIQREIARILDEYSMRVEKLKAELSAELTARQKQFEYYRESLMKFDDVQYVSMDFLFPNIRNGFVGTVTKYFTDKETGVRYLEGTNIHNGVISDNEELYVTRDFHKKHIKNELKADDILMVQSGHIGECAVVGEKYKGANCHALIIMSNGGNCVSKFYVHYFHTIEGMKHLKPAITDGNLKHVLAGKMSFVKVPFPPVEEQQRIVEILDRFDTLCNNLTSDLPAEIEARQKQYEYYRDKLLTFKELKPCAY